MNDNEPIVFHFSELHFRAALMLAVTGGVLVITENKFKDEIEGRQMIEKIIEEIIDIERKRIS